MNPLINYIMYIVSEAVIDIIRQEVVDGKVNKDILVQNVRMKTQTSPDYVVKMLREMLSDGKIDQDEIIVLEELLRKVEI